MSKIENKNAQGRVVHTPVALKKQAPSEGFEKSLDGGAGQLSGAGSDLAKGNEVGNGQADSAEGPAGLSAAPPRQVGSDPVAEGDEEAREYRRVRLPIIGTPVYVLQREKPVRYMTKPEKNSHGRMVQEEITEPGKLVKALAVITKVTGTIKEHQVNLAVFDDQDETIRWKKNAVFSETLNESCWSYIDD